MCVNITTYRLASDPGWDGKMSGQAHLFGSSYPPAIILFKKESLTNLNLLVL
jgi:hypothetical protein